MQRVHFFSNRFFRVIRSRSRSTNRFQNSATLGTKVRSSKYFNINLHPRPTNSGVKKLRRRWVGLETPKISLQRNPGIHIVIHLNPKTPENLSGLGSKNQNACQRKFFSVQKVYCTLGGSQCAISQVGESPPWLLAKVDQRLLEWSTPSNPCIEGYDSFDQIDFFFLARSSKSTKIEMQNRKMNHF